MSARRSFRGGSRSARGIRSLRSAVATVSLLVCAVLLTGCVGLIPAPKTTYVDAQGDSVTVNWRDFPGIGGTDARAVLEGPTVEETEARSRAVLDGVRDAISEYLESSTSVNVDGAAWNTARSDENWDSPWSPGIDNGYGGRSMLQIYNSKNWELEIRVPEAEWGALLDAAGEAAAGFGLTDRFDTTFDDPVEAERLRWLADTTFSQLPEFLSVSVSDAALDEAALRDAKETGFAVASINVMYGVSALHEQDRAEFERRAAPFETLEHPALTS